MQRALKTKNCLSEASYFLFSPQVVCGSHRQAQPQKAFLVLTQLVVFRDSAEPNLFGLCSRCSKQSFVALDKRNARNCETIPRSMFVEKKRTFSL
jgi:hypothetical protein